ncbi:MAG TPA: hypothetical protein VKJ01_00910, partial [Candidatus Solibacter sp.]|nr:hypothetical protein [Candidatus Solibacter sp.]
EAASVTTPHMLPHAPQLKGSVGATVKPGQPGLVVPPVPVTPVPPVPGPASPLLLALLELQAT